MSILKKIFNFIDNNNAVKLYAPSTYWDLCQNDHKRICNGCGPKSAFAKWIPDTIYGLDISECCNIHDYMYEISGCFIDDKEKADRAFLNNMYRTIETNTKFKFLKKMRYNRAYLYYLAVKKFGGSAFWRNKNSSKQERFVCKINN